MENTLKPTSQKTRLLAPDIIRGFALLGVLLVNLTMIDATLSESKPYFTELSGINAAAAFFIYFFAKAKFYTIFSFLFGFGFFLFCDKPSELRPEHYFKRRLYILFLFGVLHLIFVWYGDILHTYAICGFLLLSSAHKPKEKILRHAAIFLTASILIMGLFSAHSHTNGLGTSLMDNSINTYTTSNYFEMVKYRVKTELPLVAINLPFVLLRLIGIFYIGYWVGIKRVFQNLESFRPSIKKIWWLAFGGFALSIAIEVLGRQFLQNTFTNNLIIFVSNECGSILGASFYVTSILLALKHPIFVKILKPLSYSGRMALTNYLTQTIFFTTLIYGYGGNFFHKIPMYGYILLAFSFYSLQMIISTLWLKNHSFGPMEKIWRRLTYGQKV